MSRPAKTVLVSPFFDAATPSGGVLYSLDVSREWLLRGREVIVVCSSQPRSLGDLQTYVDAGQLALEPIIPAENIRFTHEPDDDLYARTASLIDRVKPDIIHAHNIHGCLSAIEAAVDSSVPVVFTALDFGLLCMCFYLYDGTNTPCEGPLSSTRCADCVMRDTHGLGCWLGRLLPLSAARKLWPQFARLHQSRQVDRLYGLMRKIRTGIDALIAPSPIMADRFRRFGTKDEAIFEMVYGVAAEKRVHPEKVISEKLRFAFLGSGEPIKGLATIASALERLPDGLPFEVRAIGGEAVARVVAEYPERVQRYLKADGPLFGRALAEAHAEIDAVLVPSLWHENSPFVVLESLANGTPVLAADQAGIRELLIAGQTGWLIEPGNPDAWTRAFIDAILRPALIRRMQANAHYERTTVHFVDELEQVERSL